MRPGRPRTGCSGPSPPLGVDCRIIAPGLIPVRPGTRVKTERRDARKLASLFRAGELTAVRIPPPEDEAVRDLIRARGD